MILGIGRLIVGPYIHNSFGFDGSELQPFNQAPFVPDFPITPTYITLDDDMYRTVLLYKALANISASDAATQNRLLDVLTQTGLAALPGTAYVLEVAPMVIRWVFETRLTFLQRVVFERVGTLARGAGVGWELYAVNPRDVFGFDGSAMQPFNQAPFAEDNLLRVHGS